MDFELDATTRELSENLWDFVRTHVVPAGEVFTSQLESAEDRWAWSTMPVLDELRTEARSRGLWNLFLPAEHGDLGAGTDQPAVRAPGRDHRTPRAARAGRDQLLRTRHGQHGGADDVRHPRAAGALAAPPAGR